MFNCLSKNEKRLIAVLLKQDYDGGWYRSLDQLAAEAEQCIRAWGDKADVRIAELEVALEEDYHQRTAC